MEYRLVSYNPDLKGDVAELLTFMGHADPDSSRRYFEWKYEHNPFIREPHASLVLYGTKVVGMRGLFGTRWSHGDGPEVTLPHADDLVVRPEHRNKGLFVPVNDHLSKLARDSGFSHIISLSGGLTTQQLSLVAGWEDVGELERLWRSKPSGRLAFAGRVCRALRHAIETLGSRETDSAADAVKIRLPRATAIDELLARLTAASDVRLEADSSRLSEIASATDTARLHHVRTPSYYRWRLQNPTRKYRRLLWSGSGSEASLILSWTTASALDIKIAEVRATDEQAIYYMLRALARLRSVSLELMESTQPQGVTEKALDVGFLRSRELRKPLPPRRFLLLQTGATDPTSAFSNFGLNRLQSWQVSLIDTMAA